MKRCPRCQKSLPTSDFYPSKRTPDGLMTWCKLCRKIDAARRKAENPARDRAIHRKADLKHMYSLTLEDYEKLVALQGGRCAICHQKPGRTALRVDHDHNCCPGPKSCGKCIRGLLCNNCNYKLLGHICRETEKGQEHAVETLYRAIRYIRQTDVLVMAI